MNQTSIPELVARLIAVSDGSAEKAAKRLGTSISSLSRWQSGNSRPREQLEERLRAIVEGSGDLVVIAERGDDASRLDRLEEAISGTIHALREEFHRTASVTNRQEVLDLVAALFFAHVTAIDSGSTGIGEHLRLKGEKAVVALNRFMQCALASHLPKRDTGKIAQQRIDVERFFSPLSAADEQFAKNLLRIFERDAGAFRDLHNSGRDDLINEVFSRFMSTSFVDEKEMGQYLTPTEIVRFMVELGFNALKPEMRARLLDPKGKREADFILDPSCGVGSFLAETVRFLHSEVRQRHNTQRSSHWLHRFVEKQIVGIDKSERMIRLAMINLGLFGASAANLELANGLARSGSEGELCAEFEGKVQLILTNPPFGATYKGDDISNFAMGGTRAKAESEVLFLERYVDWLAPGGVVVSIVPDSILVNRGAFAQLRSMLDARCWVVAVISLPTVTFGAAGTNTKTSVLVLRKKEQEMAEEATFFGEAREVGFDVVTRSGQRRRIRRSQNDLPALLAEFTGSDAPNFGRRRHLAPGADRWDAGFHRPDNLISRTTSGDDALLKVSDVATLVDERNDPRQQREREFDYVEISDIDVRAGLVGHKRIIANDAPSRARKRIKAGDVLVSTVRPERGSIGVVPERLDGAICSTGFAVLRCTAIHPIALVWLLKTEFVRKQMIRNNIGIAYPAISEATCLELTLPTNHAESAKLSIEAPRLAVAQGEFEAARRDFLTLMDNHLSVGQENGSGQLPDLIEIGEPRTVTDVA